MKRVGIRRKFVSDCHCTLDRDSDRCSRHVTGIDGIHCAAVVVTGIGEMDIVYV